MMSHRNARDEMIFLSPRIDLNIGSCDGRESPLVTWDSISCRIIPKIQVLIRSPHGFTHPTYLPSSEYMMVAPVCAMDWDCLWPSPSGKMVGLAATSQTEWRCAEGYMMVRQVQCAKLDGPQVDRSMPLPGPQAGILHTTIKQPIPHQKG